MSSGPFTQSGTGATARQITAVNCQPWVISGGGGTVTWIGSSTNPPPISSQFMFITNYGLSIPPNATVIAVEVTIPLSTVNNAGCGFTGLGALNLQQTGPDTYIATYCPPPAFWNDPNLYVQFFGGGNNVNVEGFVSSASVGGVTFKVTYVINGPPPPPVPPTQPPCACTGTSPSPASPPP